MAETATVHQINKNFQAAPTPAQSAPTQETPAEIKAPKLKLTRILPTERITLDKQLHLLRAYAAAYAHSGEPVSGRQVATVAKMNRNTISMAHAFLADVGFLERSGSGFVPSSVTVAFQHAHDWNAETAPTKLAPALQKMWFTQKLMPHVMLAPISEEAAIRELAADSSAGPEHKAQLRMILELLERSGVLKREGDSYAKGSTSSVREADTANVSVSQNPQIEPKETSMPTPSVPARSGGGGTTTTTFHQMTAGAVQFSINLKVDMAEFAGWQPDRITAFFAGIAQVLAAKAKVEQDMDV